jgi:hypothetical protein
LSSRRQRAGEVVALVGRTLQQFLQSSKLPGSSLLLLPMDFLQTEDIGPRSE